MFLGVWCQPRRLLGVKIAQVAIGQGTSAQVGNILSNPGTILGIWNALTAFVSAGSHLERSQQLKKPSLSANVIIHAR